MFSKQNTKDSSEVSSIVKATIHNRRDDIPSIIAADLRIVGNITCSGSIEVEGNIEGNVTCGNVTVRRTGSIKGDINADVVQIDGEVNGLVKGRNINLSETGRITGMIMYEALSVKDGAYIDGQCKSTDKLHKGAVEAIEVHNSNSEQHFIEREKVTVEV